MSGARAISGKEILSSIKSEAKDKGAPQGKAPECWFLQLWAGLPEGAAYKNIQKGVGAAEEFGLTGCCLLVTGSMGCCKAEVLVMKGTPARG